MTSALQAKSRKYRGMFEVNSPEKLRQVREKDWSQQLEHMEVPNGTEPGVRRSKRPLSACYTRRKCSFETSHMSVKVEFGKKVTDWYKVWSVEGCQCIWSGFRMSFSIRERGTSCCLIRSPYRPYKWLSVFVSIWWIFNKFLNAYHFDYAGVVWG